MTTPNPSEETLEEGLRDRFAMEALTALLRQPITAADRHRALRAVGHDAYAIADAMMKARAQ
ncbi:MAG: hypothetical protein Q7T61_01135 [Caulobacter sp.]|nr:hypothetical protein [Caulobacter sp.]